MLDPAAIVSISDHDNIDAALHLHVLAGMEMSPISVEWTVPFRRTFFHVGVHNMPGSEATAMMREMRELTARPNEDACGGAARVVCPMPGVAHRAESSPVG